MTSMKNWEKEFLLEQKRMEIRITLMRPDLLLETRTQGVGSRSETDKALETIRELQSALNRQKNRLSKLSKELRRENPT